jgi:hypothetical protein
VKFGKTSKKRKQHEEETRWHNWRKRSIFFEPPYRKTLLVWHNLNVMHIEKTFVRAYWVLCYKYLTNQTMVRRLGLTCNIWGYGRINIL